MADHVSLQIDANFDPLASSIMQKIDRLHIRREEGLNCTIFRVPSHIKERDKSYYEPRMVSIGPLHRGKVHLESMEEQKLRYLHQMLTENPEITTERYLGMLKELEEPARRCYFESVNLDSKEFIEMLLLDGCFIIRHVMNFIFDVPDIVCGVGWSVPLIQTDLLMLENQIPFFILQSIYNLYMNGHSSSSTPNNPNLQNDRTERGVHSLVHLIVEFIVRGKETLPIESSDVLHLLHLFHHCSIPPKDQFTPN
ncbi:hypothetical protein LUZ60_014202 [Juncus effusus]|nr:hypothetical protein LUZ60_014202 [Juncus effusus]